MKKIEAVLIDLSGTLHIENTATPNAVDALKRLRASKVKIKFVTNTTKESKRVLYQRCYQIRWKAGLCGRRFGTRKIQSSRPQRSSEVAVRWWQAGGYSSRAVLQNVIGALSRSWTIRQAFGIRCRR
uniref:Haloacid dehalogenase-like hydrolase domain-containing protein 2 n=1 Tax=Lygus hesperus TaxID=30085 RepID=A0A146KYI3_LYGHE